jgi:hypothetical protein
MTEKNPTTEAERDRGDFAAQAETAAPGLVREFLDFIWHYKLWWMVPILAVLLLVGLLLVLGGSVAAPFIYPLF